MSGQRLHRRDQVAQHCTPSHTFPLPTPTLRETDVSHTRSLLRASPAAHLLPSQARPARKATLIHPSRLRRLDTSSSLQPRPSAHRAFLQAPRFHAEASSSLEGTREGLKAPERVLGPGLDGALQRPAQRLRSRRPGRSSWGFAPRRRRSLPPLQGPVMTPIFRR